MNTLTLAWHNIKDTCPTEFLSFMIVKRSVYCFKFLTANIPASINPQIIIIR
jgi:hypothetical protein